MKVLFWTSAAIIAYAYLGYPLLVHFISRWFAPANLRSAGESPKSASLILAVRNEGTTVGARVAELLGHMDRVPTCTEFIVVSDGSTDNTMAVLRGISDPRLKVVELTANVGKAQAISHAAELARSEILVFADVRQRWESDALASLLSMFSSPAIGGVSGELHLDSGSGGAKAVGLYWKYEKWIRKSESTLHSTIGVSGCIAAVRKSLFQPIPMGTILDDVYWPMCIVLRGYRVIHNDGAIALDRLPEDASAEYRRKVRTLSGNFQLLQLMPRLLLPTSNPVWWQFMSHKVLRLLVPWAIIAAVVSSAFVPGTLYRSLFVTQVVLVFLAIVGLLAGKGLKIPGMALLGSFLMLNFAAWIAFWVWISGRSTSVWHQTSYHERVK